MENTTSSTNSAVVNASPSKYFFCHMLTRDIELKDAILDLIDNCIDGVIRTKKGLPDGKESTYYNGFKINISLNSNLLIIEDNCGGIPYEIAKKYAFRFGTDLERLKEQESLPTIGLYGIGMKRAIFKMGTHATVTTRTREDETYQVIIPKEWMGKDDAWSFEINKIDDELQKLIEPGTKIEIYLNQTISDFSMDKIDIFVNDLNSTISKHYSIMIEKGLEIYLNNSSIRATPVSFLYSHADASATSYAPYIFSATIDNVHVNVIIGFYSKKTLVPQEDIDSSIEGTKRSSEDAGCTVVCNDRVVLYNNKDHLTGWGENGVPKYHTQFIGIKGIISFRSNNPSLLPTTTSKRGIDANSSIYAITKKRICEGLKKFTDYTNKWKGKESIERKEAVKTQLEPYQNFINKEDLNKKYGFSLKQSRRKEEVDGSFFIPELPKPHKEEDEVKIIFLKPKKDVLFLNEKFALDEEEKLSPGEIGAMCFDSILKEYKDKEEGETADGRS